jgi:protein-disulfide isomerase
MEDLHKKYGNDLRVVYKQLVVHPRNAMAGALAFCAAAKQNKAQEMNNLIWDKGFKGRQMDMSDVPAAEGQGSDKGPQKCWDTAEGCKFVVGFAQELQLNIEQFKNDMKGPCVAHVQKDMKELSQFSVNATPGFFINGRFLSGAQPIDNFITLIDEELKKANERGGSNYYQTWVMEKGLKSLAGN